jgi:predicted deacylase
LVKLEDFRQGTKTASSLKAFTMSGGAEISLPFMVVRGASGGPVLYLGAGIHGDEIASISVVGAVLRSLDPSKLHGSVIGVPIENPLAYNVKNRFPPIDPRVDMYDSFPGNKNGGASQIMASLLYENLISKADYVIDLHTAGGSEDTVPNAYFAPPKLGQAAVKSRELAKVFGADHYNEEYDGHDGYMHVFLATRGIPAIVAELSRYVSNAIEAGKRGVMNIMSHLGMIDDEAGPASKILVKGPPHRPTPRVTVGGFLFYRKKLGEKVQKGALIAEVFDTLGRKVDEVTSPTDGFLQTVVTSETIEPGQRIGRIAIKED